MDGLADVGRVRVHLDREREFADEIARARADDAAAHNAVRFGIEYQLGETLVPGIGDCAAGSRPGEFRDANLLPSLLRLIFSQPYPGDFRVGISHGRNDAGIEM